MKDINKFDTVDGSSESRRAKPVEVDSENRVLYIPGGCLEFLPSIVCIHIDLCVCVCYQVELFSFQSIFYLFLCMFSKFHSYGIQRQPSRDVSK